MIFLLLLAQLANATDQIDEARYVVGLTTRNTFKMIAPDVGLALGTGFSVLAPSGKTYTVTNAHVCRTTQAGYMVANRTDQYFKVEILLRVDADDLCILEGVYGSEGLRLADRSRAKEHVYIAGHPALRPLEIRAGWVISKALQAFPCAPQDIGHFLCGRELMVLTINIPIEGGSSGSSVVNGKGRVVGVVHATSVPKGHAFAIAVERLVQALKQTELLERQKSGE